MLSPSPKKRADSPSWPASGVPGPPGRALRRPGTTTPIPRHTVLEPDGFERVVKKGAPLVDIPLPQLYTLDEWTEISKLNYKTTQCIHDATFPTNSKRGPYVVVYRENFTEEMRNFLQCIGVRVTLLFSPSDLQVKDEAELLEGASVE
ncbi:MAG: hypothetical protein BJ554DRAFT_1214 [Olpidium bornovanus]|uniref:Uncharacterized protein n=1 Tax=Olpidium bornovanus TaxID=278681 RepID=A0A8H8DHM2_9FUNG|nr:MAG: hypothetical protein BJ554DRAFT_1214 [Olpidium bornovanus]